MKISKDDVLKIAKLARLKMKEEKMEKISNNLSSILNYINLLNEVDTEKVPPTFNTQNLINIFREDISINFNDTEKILRNAPESENNYFKVKKVIE